MKAYEDSLKEKIVIFGTGKMAEVACKYMEHDGDYKVVAFTADGGKGEFMGRQVVDFDTVQSHFPPSSFKMFVAVGYRKMNSIRANKYQEAKRKGYKLASFVSSSNDDIWKDVEIGDNCFILENQVIQTNTKIGNDVFMWSGNHLGHDVEIGDHAYVSAHCVLSGNVKVGESAFIGVNATIRDNVSVGDRCLIGAGALVLRDTAPDGVYAAQPTERCKINSKMYSEMFDNKCDGEDQ